MYESLKKLGYWLFNELNNLHFLIVFLWSVQNITTKCQNGRNGVPKEEARG